MAKSDEKTNDTTATLYRVNYQFVAANGALRAGAIVIDTTSAEEAKKQAAESLKTSALRHPKITSVKAY